MVTPVPQRRAIRMGNRTLASQGGDVPSAHQCHNNEIRFVNQLFQVAARILARMQANCAPAS